MSKKIIKGLSKWALVKDFTARIGKVNVAADTKVPELDSYPQNVLKERLHPDVQHLTVVEIIPHGKDVKTFVFAPDKEEGTERLGYFSAGQYIVISVKVGEATITRPYSLSSSPKESLENKYSLTIKRVGGGLCSEYALDNWTIGTKVLASSAMGTFTYEPLRDAKHIVGIAGGSGITPFFSLAKAIADGDEDCSLTLLYGSRTKSDILFYDEFVEIMKKTDKFKLINVLSNEEADDCEKGFVTAELIAKYAPSGEYSIFVCGPQAMYDFVDKEIAKLGLRRKFIRHELFGEYHNPEKNADYPQEFVGKTFKITVKTRDEERVIKASANDTLLRAMEKNGIAAPADCRSGVCGFCHSKLLAGDVYVPKTVDGRRLADFEYGYVHPCVTFPISDVKIEVFPLLK